MRAQLAARERMIAELQAKPQDASEVPDARRSACAPKPTFRVLSQGLDLYAMKAPHTVTLSQDQQQVYDAFNDWYRGGREHTFSIGGYAGTGKGQPLDTMVMTPFGPKAMGELKVGSPVSNPDGTVAKVIQVHELGERDVYKVTFSDGTSTRVTLDHLWLVKRSGKHLKAAREDVDGDRTFGRVETTEQLMAYIKKERKKGYRRTNLPLIPLTKPVALNINNKGDHEPIDPYVLGVLLGDGGVTQGDAILTSYDPDLVADVKGRLGCKVSPKSKNRRGSYYIPEAAGIIEPLEMLGVMGKYSYQKWVPDLYKHGPVDRRWGVVRGLMDTDGTVGKGGVVSYTSTSKRLADDMSWMLRSLGFRATSSSRIPTFRDKTGKKKNGRRAYTIFIQGPCTADLFHLARKKNRCRDKFNGGHSDVLRRMESIKLDGKANCRCITVDHPNGLYITNDFIVTHNSTLIGVIAKSLAASGTPIQKIAFVAFTGKASNVLRQKLTGESVVGGFRGTIHSLIYATMTKCSVCGRMLTEFNSAYHKDQLWHLENGYAPHTSSVGSVVWERKPSLNGEYNLIVIDEASMVNDSLLADLTGYKIPILAVGDHGQLPPVSGVSRLMVNPTVKLEKIHRQAETNDIIRLSRGIRETGGWPQGFSNSPNIHMVLRENLESLLEKLYDENDVADVCMIAYKNAERVRLNEIARRVRYKVEHASQLPPQPGDQLICLRNTQRTIYNGMRGVLRDPGVEPMMDYWYHGTVRFPEDRLEVDGWMLRSQFNREKTYDKLEETGLKAWGWDSIGMLFDYGYALTGHKAQGSSFKHVIVYHDKPRLVDAEGWQRWLYSSVTRASEHLYLLVD